MSWTLLKPDVRLGVHKRWTVYPYIAGLSAKQRKAHRAKRERECRKVQPAFEVTR